MIIDFAIASLLATAFVCVISAINPREVGE